MNWTSRGWVTAAVLGATLTAGIGAAEPIEIPITVHEAVRVGMTGLERQAESVRLGLPFTAAMAVTEKDGRPQLKVTGAAVYQTRTLARWPDGSVRWALVDFLTDAEPDVFNTGLSVTRGPGRDGGPDLARDAGDTIVVDTGAMRAVVNKRGFNLFEQVQVGAVTVVGPGSPGIAVTGEDGTLYTAAADDRMSVSIEENGPARCVVKAVGSHRAESGRMLGFTARMHFYKGRSQVRVYYTLQNSSPEQSVYPTIKGVDLSVRLALKGQGRFQVTRHDGVTEGALKQDETLAFVQEGSSFPNRGRSNKESGYVIRQGDTVLASGENTQFPDVAWLNLSGSSGVGATVSMRFVAGYWPCALRASGDGTIAVAPWALESEGGHKVFMTSHKTREILFDFRAKASDDPAADAFRFQYPLVARGPASWYNRVQDSQAIYPLYHFATRSEEHGFARQQGWRHRHEKRATPFALWFNHYWGAGGFDNQHDFARTTLVDFLREDENPQRGGQSFLSAEARFNYNADMSIPHQDGDKIVSNPKTTGIARKQHFEWEHRHWYGLPLYYYLTGDERIGDAARFYARLMRDGTRGMNQCRNLSYTYARVLGWGLYTLGAAYDLSDFQDEEYVRLIRQNADRLFTGKQSHTVEWLRGGIYGGSGGGGNRGAKPFLMLGYILHDGFYQAARALPVGDPLRDRIEDVIEGIQWFMAREAFYFSGDSGIQGRNNRVLWCPYNYNLDATEPANPGYFLPGEAGYSVALPIENFGQEFRENLAMTYVRACMEVGDQWSGVSYVAHPGYQATLWRLLNPKKKTEPPAAVRDLRAEALDQGGIRLTWSAPDGEPVRYQIKRADRQIVPNLNFDRDTRVWAFDPDSHINWWAAESVPNPPAPEAAGRMQTMTVANLAAGSHVFAVRSFDKAGNRSALSNQARIEAQP